jgi:hypothetical protein
MNIVIKTLVVPEKIKYLQNIRIIKINVKINKFLISIEPNNFEFIPLKI